MRRNLNMFKNKYNNINKIILESKKKLIRIRIIQINLCKDIKIYLNTNMILLFYSLNDFQSGKIKNSLHFFKIKF